MVGSVGEDAQELPRGMAQIHAGPMLLLERRHHDWDDAIDSLNEMGSRQTSRTKVYGCSYLLHDPETVSIIAVEDVGTHKGEDWHDVVEDGIRSYLGQGRHEKGSLVEGLRIIRCYKGDDGISGCQFTVGITLLRRISTRVSNRIEPGATGIRV